MLDLDEEMEEKEKMKILATSLSTAMVLLSIPIFTAYVVLKNHEKFKQLQRDNKDSNIQNFYKVLSTRRDWINVLYYPEFYLRRFLFISLPYILRNTSEGNQVQALLFLQTFHLIFIG